MRTYLQKELLIALKKAQANLITTRILGTQPLIAKLIIPLGQLAMQCLQLYKLKEAIYIIQLVKNFAHAALVTFKHITLIRLVSTIAPVLTALYSNSKQLHKNIRQLIRAHKKGDYYALGKALVHTTKTLAGRTLAHKILRTSFKIARIQNLSSQYPKLFLHGAKHAL